VIIKSLTVGPIMANCYIVGCERTKTAVVIDPGADGNRILLTLAESNLTVKYILSDILIHSLDAPLLSHLSSTAMAMGMSIEDSPPPDRTIEDGDTISFGDIVLKVIHTPGHSPGGVAFYTDGALFAGDTLFSGSVGRTDFPGGDFNILSESIRKKLFVLGDDVTVYPGHMGTTEIGIEKKYNPFVGLQEF